MAGTFDFSFESQSVIIYKPELDFFLNNPRGQVGGYVKRRGRIIVIAAKRQVGVDTGMLKESIHMLHLRDGVGQYVWIGSDNEIAYLHHEGSRPHVIVPRNQQILRFSAGGRMVYTHLVHHPGTRPNRYLSDNLILARL